jgi:hypothetical protein
MRMNCRILLIPLLLATAPALGAQEDLSGHWRLDTERSDDARDELDDALRKVASDLRPPRSGRPDPARLRRAPSRNALGRELFAPVRLAEAALLLTVTEDAVRFNRDDALAEEVWTDGRPSIVDASNPDARWAAWEDGVLWIERSSEAGTRVVEAWRHDTGSLVAEFEVRNGLLEDPVRFTQYFLPEEAPANP